MKINRRHFVGILYDCILFEYASLVSIDRTYTLSLDDLADTFAFVADFYKHNRPRMDVPCDQFILRNQLHTVAGLLDYIEEMDHGAFEIFPGNVELREETPSFASTSSTTKRDQRRQERFGGSKGRIERDPFSHAARGWTTDLYSHRGHDLLLHDTDTDLDDEYSIRIPGLSKTDIQTFLWEYAYMPEDYQDDIATLIRYLRRDEWVMNGSKGSIVTFDWDMEGVQKYSKEYNQNKIRKVELRGQEEAKRKQEAALKQQEEWNRQQELIREKEAAQRMKILDHFIWRMHESMTIPTITATEIDNMVRNLEMEISEYFGYCFVTLTPVGSFASGSYTHLSDLDLTLTGNIKTITILTLADALQHFNYEGVTLAANNTHSIILSLAPSVITFSDPKTGTTCHLTLNEPLMIYRSKLIWTYGAIEPRFGPMIVALKRLTVQRRLLSGSIYQDQRASMPLGSYALALMLITFLQTENPPILPKLQQAPSQDDHDRPMKEVIVQGIDCSFDRDWKFYRETGSGSGNIKSAAELLVDFCRFFGYVFDYESKEVNARIGAFRWRPDVSNKSENTVDDLASTGSTNVVSMTAPGAMTATTTKEKESSSAVLFQVMDPFVIGLNVMAGCSDEKVRMVKECFQEAYEALIEGDINLAFSDS